MDVRCLLVVLLLLFALVASTSAQSINVTITGGPSSPATLGAPTTYSLTCTAGPNPINVTWITPPAGTVGAQTTSGSTSSRTLTLPSPVQLSNAGLYMCNASANGVTRTTSYAFNVSAMGSTACMPGSATTLYNIVGASLTVTTCSISLSYLTNPLLDIQWIGPNGAVPSTGRISAANVTYTYIAPGAYIHIRSLTFSTLSSRDNNTTYQCRIGTLYTGYGTQYSSCSTTIVVNALVLTPTISSGTCQQGVLQLNCTADRPLSVVPPLMFSWYRSSVGSGTFSRLNPGVPGINVSRTPSGSNTSTLSISGSSVSGSYVYQCMASVDVPDDVAVVANVTTGVVSFSISGVVSRLALQSYGQLSRIVWEAPVVNCNMVSYYTVAMTTYSDGTLIEMGTTTGQNYTLTKNYNAGVPYNVTVWALFGTIAGGNTSQTIFTQELAPSSPLSVKTTSMNGNTILVSWSPLSPVEARGFVRYYLVTWIPSKARGSPGSANLTADITMYLITDLDPMVSYTISVTPGTSAGVGVVSATPYSVATTMPPTSEPVSACGTLYLTCIIPVTVILIATIIICAVSVFLIKATKRKRQDILTTPTEQNPFEFNDYIAMSSVPAKIPEDGIAEENKELAPSRDNAPNDAHLSQCTSGPVYIKDFAAHVNLMHQDRNKMFDREFQSIKDCQHSTETAALPCNKGKNRFHNISPYDNNRVLLQKIEGVEGSDYINASFIDVNYDGYKKTHAYIMAQGPMPNTVGDFWRMVFENKLDTIVMLTQCNEGGKRKCEQYWSDNVGETIEPFPGLRVTLEEASPFADYVTRKMRVDMAGSAPLSVSHYQYLGWPEFGTPTTATSFIGFIRCVRSDHAQDGHPPMVVHCSSGVGRSGVFITLDSMLEQLKVKDTVNMCEYVADIRQQRVLSVETLAQYIFIHDVLSDVITCGDTCLDASELRNRVNELRQADNGNSSGFEEQFELLEKVSYKPTDKDISEARQQYNVEKNRFQDRVSFSLSRTRLKPTGVQGSDYVNASSINGYKVRNAYIAAQAPLQNTVEDFWRMVWEFKSLNIVMLCGLDEDRVVQYWPMRPGETLMYGKMAVTLMDNPGVSPKDQITKYKLELMDDKAPDQGCTTTHLYYYSGWKEYNLPSSCVPVLMMAVKTQFDQTENKCLTVVCNDGMGRTGAFITIHAMMERLKTEHVVDFFQFIKASRAHRQNFVMTLAQYSFCHDTLAEYVDTMDQYANVKPHHPINSTLV